VVRGAFQHYVQDCGPDGEEILQIPREFFSATVDASRSEDDTHIFRNFDIVERFASEVTIFTGDTA